MKEFCIKIVETRFEYIEATSPEAALKKAKDRVILDADSVHFEIASEENLTDENEVIRLETFPNKDENYCHSFEVDRSWLVDILEKLDSFNNREGVDLERFLQNYIWDETWFIYLAAKAEERIIQESEVEINEGVE